MRLIASVLVLALAASGPAYAQSKRSSGAPSPSAAPAIPDSDFRAVDPENILLIETTKGRIVLEMSPLAAPEHIARIKQLAREKFFDGLSFHRVVDAFMAQTGDPLGTGAGQSPYPDLKGEFLFRRSAATPFKPVATPRGSVVGFVGSLPVQTQPDDLMLIRADATVAAWGLYCPGVAGMARSDAPDSANSQFFLMRQAYPSLEKRYTAWGRTIVGLDVVRAIKHAPDGAQIVDPDRVTTVRVLADIPAGERPVVRVLDTASKSFDAVVERTRQARGADFSLCDVELPAKIG